MQAKSWLLLLLSRHCPYRPWSDLSHRRSLTVHTDHGPIFHTGEVSMPCRGWGNGADYAEILGKYWACANSVYQLGSFFSTHVREPGNKAIQLYLGTILRLVLLHEEERCYPAITNDIDSYICISKLSLRYYTTRTKLYMYIYYI